MALDNQYLFKVVLLVSINIVAMSWPLGAIASPATGLLKRAQVLLEQDQDNAALVCLNTLIRNEPNNAQAYSERSRAYGRLGRYDKALEDSNKAIVLNPKLAIAYANRAAIYFVKDNCKNALADSNKAIAIEPRLATAYSVRALIYERLEKYPMSVADCNKAIVIEPKSCRHYLIRARAFRHLGQYQGALRDCNKALSLTSKQARLCSLYIERGYIYVCLGRFQKAIVSYTAAIKKKPQSSEAYLLRADAYCRLGQYQKQIDDLTSAGRIRPRLAEVYERRGYAYYQLGQLQNAIDDCMIATSLDPVSSHAYCTAAAAYEELGFYDKAIELRTKHLGPENKDAIEWNDRAKVYDLLGKFDLAQVDRQKAIEFASRTERLGMQGCSPLIDFNKLSDVDERPEGIIDKQLKRKAVVLSFKYDIGGHICVPVQVNGHSLQLMLDTGCAHSDLWRQAMPGVAEMDSVQLPGTTASGKEYPSGFFRARDLKLGTLTLSNVAMSVKEGIVGHKTLSGFLGGNILENFVVTVDYTKKQLILATASGREKVKNAIVVPMMLRNHCPHCRVRLDGKLELTALLDTGCPSSLSADSLLKPILTKKLNYQEHISGPWLGELSIDSVRLKSLGLGLLDFKTPIFAVFPAAEAPQAASRVILGNDFLSSFDTVTFDYPGRRVIFEPKEIVEKAALNLYNEGNIDLSGNQGPWAAISSVVSLPVH